MNFNKLCFQKYNKYQYSNFILLCKSAYNNNC